MDTPLDRRDFLRNSVLSGAGVMLGSTLLSGCEESHSYPGQATMLSYKTSPQDVIKIGFVGIGNMGSSHVSNLLKIEGCQITAVCDIRPEQTDWAKKKIVEAGFSAPAVYGQDDLDFMRMCKEEDLDLVYNAAPWRWHTPICLAAMENGKHTASEVNIALTIEDCWKLVEASEKYKKHCIMMENCCYDRMEMAILNMIQKGLFGQLLHGECGYLHDLRAMNLSPTYYQGMWRIYHYVDMEGNLYPTHGIGPMAWCMDINRGDTLDSMVCFSSKAVGLREYAKEHYPDSRWAKQEFKKGDVTTCLIRTKMGRTIICKHNTSLPRPYSRDFLIQGSKGIARKYPDPYIHIEGRSPEHRWEKFEIYQEEYEHPIWKNLKEKSEKAGDSGMGHGGMDYIEDYRLIQALRKGIAPDIDVYDSVLWSSIIPLSGKSISKGGAPVAIPDFTRGAWKKSRPFGSDRIL